jgi:hypothetical protein
MVDISTLTGVLSCKEAEQGRAAQIRLFRALLHDIAMNREVKKWQNNHQILNAHAVR